MIELMLTKTLKRKNIPFPAAVLMTNSILTREVACATCQWIPVVVAVGGVRVVSMMKFLTYSVSTLCLQFESRVMRGKNNLYLSKEIILVRKPIVAVVVIWI